MIWENICEDYKLKEDRNGSTFYVVLLEEKDFEGFWNKVEDKWLHLSKNHTVII